MGKPLSIKWKLTLLSIFAALALLAFVFTDGCNDYVVGKVNQGFTSVPEAERRESPWAQRYLYWATFKGSFCGDYKSAASIYKDFCGMPKDYNVKAYDYISSPAFKKDNSKKGFIGKCSPDGMNGWGPLHPDAPDAYYDYICTIEPWETSQTTGKEAKVYYILFYDWHIKHSENHKPHPKFMKYWDKIRQKALDSRVGFNDIPTFDYKAAKADKWVEPK